MDDLITKLTSFLIFAFSVIIHEVSHAYVAYRLGDDTAYRQNRITLNPLPHIDLFGSIILPALLSIYEKPLLGWAKPVPVNVLNFENPRMGNMWVAIAGPGSNIALAITAAIILKVIVPFTDGPVVDVLLTAYVMNISLAVFNMLPIPPLDGSGVLSTFMSADTSARYLELGQYGFIAIYLLIYTGILGFVLGPVISLAVFLLGIL